MSNTRDLYPKGTNFIHGVLHNVGVPGKQMQVITDTPCETYPEGSECPACERQHNSHGWYICLTMEQVYDAYGPVVIENDNREFRES